MWHPLHKYVSQVKTLYFTVIKEEYNRGIIGKDEYTDLFAFRNFNFWLKYLRFNDLKEEFKYEELLEIFKPLMINQHKNYVLFKYKGYIELNEMGYDQSTFFDLYDGLYLECRSVVFNINTKPVTIVLAAARKFKNYGEDDKQWSASNIKDLYLNARKVEITNKMDGSYQQFCCVDAEKRIFIGSGSQALDTTESWRLKKGFEYLIADGDTRQYCEMMEEFPNWTFQFEMICPENAIVVHYKSSQQGLYLFNARNNLTGEEMSMQLLSELSVTYGVPMVDWYQNETLWSILSQTKNYTSDEKEGWVLKIYPSTINEETGEFNEPIRVKIKTDDYVLMHKVLSKLISPNAIIKAIATDRIDDLMVKVPTGQKDVASGYLKDVLEYLRLVEKTVGKYYKYLTNNINTDASIQDEKEKRKTFMLNVKAWVPVDLQSYVINKYLGREKNYLMRLNSSSQTPRYFTIKEIREKTSMIKNIDWNTFDEFFVCNIG